MAQNDEFIYNLKNANPIESIISSYVQLKRQGRNQVCCCPFHSERTPSFTVFPDTQSFFCFGCGAGGDAITFIMKAENLDFTEALKFLAERSGIEMPEYDNRSKQNAERRTRIYEMNRISANFFYKNLVQGKDKSGLKYFADRRLAPQTIKKYGLGYSSDSWNELTDLLLSKGYKEDEIIDAWLGGRSQKTGKIFDIFRNRVMFPIIDLRGNIIGFGGRVLDDSKPKYLNTAQTPVFDKGSNLFSLNFAKNSDTKQIILCEGYMDVIALNQVGIENTVATLGTAITPNQARLISHYADEVIIAYDNDEAGQNAAKKAISHFSDVGLHTRILHMESAKDPDEYIKKFGVQRFLQLIKNSHDANNFMLDNCEKGLEISTEVGKAELLKRASKFLAGIENKLEREVYISRTAKKYDFPVDVLKDYINGIINKNNYAEKKKAWLNIKLHTTSANDNINPEASEFKTEAAAEEYIIYYLMMRPEDAEKIEAEAPADVFITSFNKKVYSVILSSIKNGENFSASLNSEFSVDEVGKIIGIQAKNREISVNPETFSEYAKLLENHKSINHNDDISDEALRNMFSAKK